MSAEVQSPSADAPETDGALRTLGNEKSPNSSRSPARSSGWGLSFPSFSMARPQGDLEAASNKTGGVKDWHEMLPSSVQNAPGSPPMDTRNATPTSSPGGASTENIKTSATSTPFFALPSWRSATKIKNDDGNLDVSSTGVTPTTAAVQSLSSDLEKAKVMPSTPAPNAAPSKAKGLQVYIREALNILCAAASVAAAISSYLTLVFAQTDLNGVVATWQTTPIKSVVLVPSTSACPANFTQVPTLAWPGAASLGCGCPASSSLSSSSSSSCSSAQLAAGCVVNVPGGLPSLQLDAFRGSKVCYQRGLASYMDVRDPDPISFNCTSGYHKCGGSLNGTYASDRSQCVPDSLGSGCPVNWLGSGYFVSQALKSSASAAVAGKARLKSLLYKSGEVLYEQFQNTRPAVVKLQLPVIDLVFAIQQNAGDRGPCYNGANQSAYIAPPGAGLPGYPSPCNSVDARWQPLDLNAEQSQLGDNFMASASASSRCASFSSIESAAASDYFTSGLKCNTSARASWDWGCETGVSSTASCASSDTTCQSTFYQSRCGHLARAALGAQKKIGLYMRQQTYWSDACPFSPSQVRATTNPFSQAIMAQYALLVVNCFMNLLQALISVYIVVEKLLRLPGTEGKIKGSWISKLARFGQFAKLPVIVASVVLVNVIYSFYTTLAKSLCSDDITNATFSSLGQSLPSVFYGNVATLVVDGFQLLVLPLLVFLHHKRRGGGGGGGQGLFLFEKLRVVPPPEGWLPQSGGTAPPTAERIRVPHSLEGHHDGLEVDMVKF